MGCCSGKPSDYDYHDYYIGDNEKATAGDLKQQPPKKEPPEKQPPRRQPSKQLPPNVKGTEKQPWKDTKGKTKIEYSPGDDIVFKKVNQVTPKQEKKSSVTPNNVSRKKKRKSEVDISASEEFYIYQYDSSYDDIADGKPKVQQVVEKTIVHVKQPSSRAFQKVASSSDNRDHKPITASQPPLLVPVESQRGHAMLKSPSATSKLIQNIPTFNQQKRNSSMPTSNYSRLSNGKAGLFERMYGDS